MFDILLLLCIVFSWRSLLPFGRGKKSTGNPIEKQNIANPTNFRSADFELCVTCLTGKSIINRKIASATSDSNVMPTRCLGK